MEESLFLILTLVLVLESWYIVLLILKWRSVEVVIPLASMLILGLIPKILPAVYAFSSGSYLVSNYGFPLQTWNLGLTIEVLFVGATIIGIQLGVNRRPRTLVNLEVTLTQTPASWWFLLCLFFLLLFVQGFFAGDWTSFRYESAGMYTRTSLDDTAVTIGGLYRYLSFTFLTPVAFTLVFAKEKPRHAIPFIVIVAALYLLPTTLTALVAGARGPLIALSMMSFVVWGYNSDGKILQGALFIAVAVLVTASISPGLRAYRSNSIAYVGISDWTRLQILQSYLLDTDLASDEATILESTILRLDEVQDSGILAEATETNARFALLQPYLGVVFAYIPRYFWPDKPVPFSIDNSVMGTPPYLVGALRGTPWNSAGVSAAGVAYWQFWWPGVLLSGLLNGLLLMYMSCLTLRSGLVGLALYLSVAQSLYFLMMASFDTWLSIVFRVIVVYVLLHLLFIFLYRSVRHKPGFLQRLQPYRKPAVIINRELERHDAAS